MGWGNNNCGRQGTVRLVDFRTRSHRLPGSFSFSEVLSAMSLNNSMAEASQPALSGKSSSSSCFPSSGGKMNDDTAIFLVFEFRIAFVIEVFVGALPFLELALKYV